MITDDAFLGWSAAVLTLLIVAIRVTLWLEPWARSRRPDAGRISHRALHPRPGAIAPTRNTIWGPKSWTL